MRIPLFSFHPSVVWEYGGNKKIHLCLTWQLYWQTVPKFSHLFSRNPNLFTILTYLSPTFTKQLMVLRFLAKKVNKHPNSNSVLKVLQKCGGKLRISQWIKYCCWIIKLVLIFCRIWPFLKSSWGSEVARLPQGKTLVYLLQGMEAANINWGCVQSPYHFSSAQLSKSTEHFFFRLKISLRIAKGESSSLWNRERVGKSWV